MAKLDPTDYVPRIKRLREQGMGLGEARKQVNREYLLNAIDEARNFYELRGVMRACMEKLL
ncbi:hypothetical protein QQF51_05120 [Brucella intermedia]|uniref:hypothetical protein n=1 Tax=Brucella intermedia TaxID=94625 RepID=UPI0025579F6D|nr:hypothetical protein [Brucella intermedia]MDL2202050.1 hypothetical protein [Brucella intermedia]